MPQDEAKISVRIAAAPDAGTLAHVFEFIEAQTVSSASLLERLMAAQDFETALLAEQNEQVVGMICLRLAPTLSGVAPYAEISELFTYRAQQVLEIERALLRQAEALAVQRGARQLVLLTGLRNIESQERYRALGYREFALAMRRLLSA
ncbi:MAG: GNAT family N-acetyltransferase [Anaerolineales bacterium]|nr:GNAT family N-acetyltransferase [Anaerolineales bacterium]